MVTEPESRFAGLAFLLEQAQRVGKVLYSGLADKYEVPVTLPAHPFDLPIPLNPRSDHPDRIELVGYPGYTDVSIRTMGAYLADWLTYPYPDSFQYLRVILAECDSRYPERHNVYYEVGWQDRIFICGGCTDFSGAGGMGKLRMDSLFAFLSEFFGIRIETVTIPFAQAEGVERYLCTIVDSEEFWKAEMQRAGR